MYYTVIKHSGHLRTLEKCRKHSPAARVVYISLVFSNARRVLSQCNTRLRLLYLLNNYDSPLSQLIRLQNKAVRIMNGTPLRDPITPYYANYGLLKFRDIVKLHSCLFFNEHLCENKPSNFPVTLVSEQHNYFTRGASAQQLLIPFSRINMRKFCPTVIGKYYWNALPVCIRDLTTKTSFKEALCKYYLAQY